MGVGRPPEPPTAFRGIAVQPCLGLGTQTWRQTWGVNHPSEGCRSIRGPVRSWMTGATQAPLAGARAVVGDGLPGQGAGQDRDGPGGRGVRGLQLLHTGRHKQSETDSTRRLSVMHRTGTAIKQSSCNLLEFLTNEDSLCTSRLFAPMRILIKMKKKLISS